MLNKKHTSYRRRYDDGGHSRWYYLLRGILWSFAVTVPMFFILSLAVTITEFPEEYMHPAILVTMVASIILAAYLATAGAKNSGWNNGRLVGFLYMMIVVIVRWGLEKRFYIDKDILTMLLTGILLGSVSGMAGLNLADRISNYKAMKSKNKNGRT